MSRSTAQALADVLQKVPWNRPDPGAFDEAQVKEDILARRFRWDEVRDRARRGDHKAQCILAQALTLSLQWEDDPEPILVEIEILLRSAMLAGSMRATGMLGDTLVSSDDQDEHAEGEGLLRLAAVAGDPQAMRNLGIRLLEGDTLRLNRAEGRLWLCRAAQAGDWFVDHALGDVPPPETPDFLSMNDDAADPAGAKAGPGSARLERQERPRATGGAVSIAQKSCAFLAPSLSATSGGSLPAVVRGPGAPNEALAPS